MGNLGGICSLEFGHMSLMDKMTFEERFEGAKEENCAGI